MTAALQTQTVAAPPVFAGPAEFDLRLAVPLAIFFCLFFAAPLILLFFVSLFDSPSFDSMGFSQYGKLLFDAFNLSVLWETLLLGAKVTLLCLVTGYPLAWCYCRMGARAQSLAMLAILLPLLTSVVVRTFAWIVILGRQGIVNATLLELGFIDAPLRLLYSEQGLIVALAQVQLPLMVLPLITALQRIDPNLADASAALGAGHWRTFFKVTLPLSLPGMLAGATLTYAAAVTAFITQTLVGGGRLVYMPMFVYQQAIGANNWPFAAAASILFMLAVLGVVGLLGYLGKLALGRARG